MGCSRGTVYDLRMRKNYLDFWAQHDEKPTAGGVTDTPDDRIGTLIGSRFVFVTAQNNTYVHDKFYRSLQHFMEVRGAALVCGRSYYNINGFQNLTDENDDESWFDAKIRESIIDRPMKVADGLYWHGNLNILPTVVNPFNGMHNFVKSHSGIIPHVKCGLQSLPSHVTEDPRFLYTTCSITLPNYIQKTAGQKAEFHHVIGALYVEVSEDGTWFARHLHADSSSGEFYDLNDYFTPDGVEDRKGEAVVGINWGDLHVEHLDPNVAMASFGIDIKTNENGEYFYDNVENEFNMLDYLKPKTTFCHDTSDFAPRNHHNINDPHFRFAKHNTVDDNVEASLKRCADLISAISRSYSETVVVQSNHDLALVKWLKTADYRQDPENAMFFLRTQYDFYEAIQNRDEDYNVFADVMRKQNPDLYTKNVTFLRECDPYMLLGEGGIQCGYHGHNGTGGSRGSTQSFAKLGYRVNIGHQHKAEIFQGVYVAGVCTRRDLDYAKGAPSMWSNSHIVTYANGKRCIITIKDGRWRDIGELPSGFTPPDPKDGKLYFSVEGGEVHGLAGSYPVPDRCVVNGEPDNEKVIRHIRNKLQYMGPIGLITYGE